MPHNRILRGRTPTVEKRRENNHRSEERIGPHLLLAFTLIFSVHDAFSKKTVFESIHPDTGRSRSTIVFGEGSPEIPFEIVYMHGPSFRIGTIFE